MRNNENRIGGAMQNADSPPVDEVNNGSNNNSHSLNFVVPTDFVELPSRGKYYPEGHALRDKEFIEIRQMTAKDEDILTSRALLQRGLAIDRLLNNLIVDKQIDPDEILVGDKNAIMVAARASAYGNEYLTSVQCPTCQQNSDNEFDLNDGVLIGPDSEETEAQYNEDKLTYNISLPASKVSVEVKFLTSNDEKRLLHTSEQKKKHKLVESVMTDQMKSFIVSVNNISDPSEIARFVDNMPARDSRYLRTVYTKLTPNIDLTQEFVCKYCLTETTMEVPFTADFFWPRQ